MQLKLAALYVRIGLFEKALETFSKDTLKETPKEFHEALLTCLYETKAYDTLRDCSRFFLNRIPENESALTPSIESIEAWQQPFDLKDLEIRVA